MISHTRHSCAAGMAVPSDGRSLLQPRTFLAKGFATGSLAQVFRFDVVTCIALGIVVMDVLLD